MKGLEQLLENSKCFSGIKKLLLLSTVEVIQREAYCSQWLNGLYQTAQNIKHGAHIEHTGSNHIY